MVNNSKPFQTKLSEMVSLHVASQVCLLSYTELYLLVCFMQFFSYMLAKIFTSFERKIDTIRSLGGFYCNIFDLVCFFLWNLAWNRALPLVFVK